MDRETEALAKIIASIIKQEGMDEQQAGVWWDEIGDEIGLLMDDPVRDVNEFNRVGSLGSHFWKYWVIL